MQADHEQPWTLCVQAKAKNFFFKFRATKKPFSPTSNFFPFSIFFHLRTPSFLTKFKFHPQISFPRRKPKSVKSKLLIILQKFRIRPTKNKAMTAKRTSNFRPFRCFAYEGPICVCWVIVGNLVFLYESIYEMDQNGIIMHSSILLLYLASMLKKLVGRRRSNLLVIINVAMLFCSIVVPLKNHFRFDKGCVWKAWNYVTSSRCLYALSQVIVSGFSKYMRAIEA